MLKCVHSFIYYNSDLIFFILSKRMARIRGGRLSNQDRGRGHGRGCGAQGDRIDMIT